VAFRTKNTIQNISRPRLQIDKYSRSGIYQMKCMDCPLKYVGQTGRTFNTRYEEHIHNIRSNNSNTGYSNHILNTGHTYGTMQDTMETITLRRKGKYLNTLEKYHIYKVSKAAHTRCDLLYNRSYYKLEMKSYRHVVRYFRHTHK
jgi:hypothetical protein